VNGASPVPIVYDVNVLVGAAAGGNSPFRSWPSPPPTSGNPYADCLGIVVDAVEFALWLSPHILENTVRVLIEGLKWPSDRTEQYAAVVVNVAEHSGGGVVDPPSTVHDCRDHEDNRILDLAVEVGAMLLVSDDTDLTSMSPWRGTPILRPREFSSKVDAMRRHRRRRR
jgi:putative PIN family toxin of toxin-antitoxin system